MPGMDLATLSIPDLRRVLELARVRGQAELANDVLAELRARAGAPAAGLAGDTPATGQRRAEPSYLPAAGAKDGARWHDEDPDLSPRRRARVLIGGIAAAAVLAAMAGWALTQTGILDLTARAGTPPVASSKAAMAAPVDSMNPGPAPKAEIAAAAPQSEAAPPDEAPAPATQAPVAVTPKRTATTAAATKPRAACLAKPTPADRLVCGYPSLGRQHDRMLAAYNRVLGLGGSDALALDADQAKWRTVRDRVSDRRELAELYQARIRELDAIAARPAPAPEPKAEREQPIF